MLVPFCILNKNKGELSMKENKRKKSVIIRVVNNEIQIENIEAVKIYLNNIENYCNKDVYIKRKKALQSKKRAKRSLKELNKIIVNNKDELETISKVLYTYKDIDVSHENNLHFYYNMSGNNRNIYFVDEEQKNILRLVLKLTTTRPGNNPLPPIED